MKISMVWKRGFGMVLLLGMVLALGGCHHSPETSKLPPLSADFAHTTKFPRGTSQPSGSSVAPLVAVVTRIQERPEYRQAQADCRQKRYKQAAHRLQLLASSRELSASERSFVETQRNICLTDAHLPVLPKGPIAVTPAKSVPVRRHLTAAEADCGPRSLLFLCEKLGLGQKVSLVALRQAAGTTGDGTTFEGLAKALHSVGLKAEGVQVSRTALATITMPAVAFIHGNHFVAVLSTSGSGEGATAVIHDPNNPQEQVVSQEQLLRMSGGYLLTVHR